MIANMANNGALECKVAHDGSNVDVDTVGYYDEQNLIKGDNGGEEGKIQNVTVSIIGSSACCDTLSV